MAFTSLELYCLVASVDQYDLSSLHQLRACVQRHPAVKSAHQNHRDGFDELGNFATLKCMVMSGQGLLAAQAFIDELQVAACECQSDMGTECKGLLQIVFQELGMLKTLANQVSCITRRQ